jgi:rare lipoprotein A
MIIFTGALLAACSSAPLKKTAAPAAVSATKKTTTKVNPISRLPPQTLPVPKLSDMPVFGSDEFNRIKDVAPESPPDVSQVPDAIPVDEPLSEYGNKSPYQALGETYKVMEDAKGFTQTGKASWYGKKFHGLKTSSGEKYNMYKMTAAHTTLPLPTYVRVTNLANDKSVIVKVNDRGPFHSERIMDLSYAAAARLDYLKTGTANVRIEVVTAEDFKGQPASADKKEKYSSSENNTRPAEPRFFVQVGAFSARGNATTLQGKLADLINAPVVVARDENSSNGISRVRIGPFSSAEEAEKAATIIRDNNLGKPIILKR